MRWTSWLSCQLRLCHYLIVRRFSFIAHPCTGEIVWWKCCGRHVHHSLPHLHKQCAPNNTSERERDSWHAQLCPGIVVTKKDEEEKLEALPS
eukprot:6211350-Ditylum_brightwellii.AAC.1